MRITRLPTVHGSAATRCQHCRGGSSSEQFWTGFQSWPPDVTSRGVPVREVPWGDLYSEVQCIMGNGHMGPLWTDRLTDTHD